MKVIYLIPATLILLTLGLTNCSKDCEPTNATCSETPPTNEACLAYFERWFFSKEKNNCEKIGYSGCSPKGFATQQECEECKCR
jgi:hypothetical protein